MTEVTQSVEKQGQGNLKSDEFASFVDQNSVLAIQAETEVIEKAVEENDIDIDTDNDNETENENDKEISATTPDSPRLECQTWITILSQNKVQSTITVR